ncbi:hypothetical protein DI396_00900 [Litorivita pollutaquae]|uniref:Bacteriophage phiJL001 Gp84 C-terminal domain-containing protein n=2 Tax=Litorivita pollutaquae TaxID=2200892 RepID=A0A2V4NUN1_9RHOB|nr:hypothetical protein DI396_00900 [Litorivita pollutaquae]
MMGYSDEFKTHLASGATTLCRTWAIMRSDGAVFGFTDHDVNLTFEGITFKADSGLTAMALAQSTGLAVDNTEAIGALRDAAIKEADIEAGRFDGAEVRAWLVNWADVSQREMQFRGSIGELRRTNGAFTAELRGLTEALNRPLGRVYQKPCSAVLGDRACAFELTAAGYFAELAVEAVEERQVFRFDALTGFDDAWFARGRLIGQSGACVGLSGMVKRDYFDEQTRVIELWAPMRAPIVAGDMIRLEAGCDKRMETCRLKFNNIANYQGFPDLPGDDWTVVPPSQSGISVGGSRR